MRHVMFCHSIRSDWNHGNAHFLRGVAAEAVRRGHGFDVHEPLDGWSARNLAAAYGTEALEDYRRAYPELRAGTYGKAGPDLDAALQDADIVLVHEWTDPDVVRGITEHHARAGNYGLYFHDTHHRAITAPKQMAGMPLDRFDGVLAFGDALRDQYLEQDWTDHAWTWHEAADPTVFRPMQAEPVRDLVWIGNWGDGERTEELEEFLMGPARRLGLQGTVHGVRYPGAARRRLADAGLDYRGWLPNTSVPEVFGDHRVTVHVPRRPYLEILPGIPTIRMFEAFASGIPLVVARWQDTERLFTQGQDYLLAEDGQEMQELLRGLLDDPERAARLADRARKTILERHTCGHRLDELHRIHNRLAAVRSSPRHHVAFFGSSLVSSYWNGAATYYRGLLAALARMGHEITFYEPATLDRHQHQDIEPPSWARVHIYDAEGQAGVRAALATAREADVVVKASGVGAHDELLEREVLDLGADGRRVFFWDVDAPATLDRIAADPSDPLREHLRRYDGVFTYGGGPRVVREYERLGARRCVPVYNAVDPATHHPVEPSPAWQVDLAFLGNRLPDREERVRRFFLEPAAAMPERRFLLGGSGWQPEQLPPNVDHVGHVGTAQHNRFNCSPLAVLNINRTSMADYGHSPPTRIFEAAGAGACIITDDWPGIDMFLEPGKEILVARDGAEVQAILEGLSPERAAAIGQAARRRVLREHTYAHRAMQVTAELARRPEVLA